MKKLNLFVITLLLLIIPINISASKAVVDITNISINEIQDAIDKGYLTYELLTKLYIERIEEYNEEYNAIININEKAIDIAKERDKEYKESGRKSDIFGIPIILKDNIDYDGLPTTAGSKALSGSVPFTNASVVQNLIDKGAIVIAKSNMSEFAFSAANSYSSYGHVKNAYNTSYTPYGSSGGSAVSVALSFAPLALGTDTGSSVRLPSAAASIVGLRPTYNLIDTKGVIKYDVTRDTLGPMTKTVEENAILLTSMVNGKTDYTKYLDVNGLESKKIIVLEDFIKKKSSSVRVLSSYYEEIENLMNDAIKTMEKSGAQIIYVEDFYKSEYDNLFDTTAFGRSMCYEFNQYILNTTSKIKSFNSLVKTGGYVQSLLGYNKNCSTNLLNTSTHTKNQSKKESFKEKVYALMDEYEADVIIFPSQKSKVLTLVESVYSPTFSPTYTIAPLTGMPEISVPLGYDSNNLAYGMEILAKEGKEDIIYEVAYAYETASKIRENPKDAPSLYEINEYVLKLKEHYEKDFFNKKEYKKDAYNSYIEVLESVEDYLKNYNEKDEKEAEKLLENYEKEIENLENNKRIKPTIIIIGVFITLLLFVLIIKKRKKRK